ncbi:MAG TPA: NADH-dependent alcohol dehydrogenase [Bacteroidales bacterium]|nr:MAG: aldehyde reductase [Bacteroidetes bacterium GWE2_42_24]OFY30100.1 MAG: aldehyde reductase [Bacteroidetes bacterium GWF2_43_11]HAQ64853.1 NADH-dependent alcohol dehydrogenase [Bacteroidales bacterium]HBZ67909.1 NADH-dependent alcohol dehydrogenase [Bacteroidales bacterium]
MKNFTYYNPTKIHFGKGQISTIDTEIPSGARIMLTYGGGSIKTNGIYDQVIKALGERHIVEFSGIEANPRYETLMKAVVIIREQKLDYLLAVGGGSVVDGTKFIAAAVDYPGDPWDFCTMGIQSKSALPIGVVLTLAATGSEMNSGGVITREEQKSKRAFGNPLVFPKFSVLDPETTFSLPPRQVTNGIVDAFVHTTEQYLTFPAHAPLQDRQAEGILLTLIEEGPKALLQAPDYDNRANLMWCATQALNGLIGTGVPQDWATHMIGHELTALHGLDHAVTLAIVWPGVMHIMKDEKKEKLLQYAKRVWLITEGTDDEKIKKAITLTDNFFRSLGVKTRLSEHQIGSVTINKIAERLQGAGMAKLGERGTITPEKVIKILNERL